MRGLCAGLVLVAGLGVGPARADDAKEKFAGPWVRDADGTELGLRFPPGKDRLEITVKTGETGVTITTKATRDKDGTVRAEVLAADETGDFAAKPPKGMKFQFKFAVGADGKTATVSDYSGPMGEEAKQYLEGEYKLKPAK